MSVDWKVRLKAAATQFGQDGGYSRLVVYVILSGVGGFIAAHFWHWSFSSGLVWSLLGPFFMVPFTTTLQLFVGKIISRAKTRKTPPLVGEFLLCLLLPVGEQKERIGDFEETYNTIWVPKFGASGADCIYVLSVLQSALGFKWAVLTGALVDAAGRVWSSW